MFEAGAIAYRVQMVGAEVFQRDVDGADRSMGRLGTTSRSTASALELSGKKSREAAAGVRQFSADTERSMNTVGRVFIGAGLAVAAMVALSVVKFAQYDKSLSGLGAITHSTREELDDLGDAAIDAGAKFGFSATEAISGEEALAKAGVTTSQIMGGALTGSLTLAAAGQLGVAESAEVAAIAMVQFKKDGKDVPHIADLIAAGAGKAVGDVDDMAMAMKQGGLVSSQFGVSLEETVGTLSAFAAAGLIGSDAGTSYKTMLLSLSAPSSQAAAELKKYNIQAYDQQGNFVTIANLAGQLKTNLGQASQAERDHALSVIFGTDAIRAASVLYAQGSAGIQKWTADVDDSGYAAQQAADRLDNLEGDIGKLSAAMDRGLIKNGSAANDVLRDTVQVLTELSNWYGDLPPEAQRGATAIGVGTAAVLVFSGVLFLAIPKAAAFKFALDDLNLSWKKLAIGGGGAFVALSAVVAILGALASANAESRSRVEALTATLEQNTGAFTENTRAQVAKNLQNNVQLIEYAKKYGIALSDLTDSALGVPGALDRVKAAWQASKDAGVGDGEFGAGTSFNYLGNQIGYAAGEAEKSKEQWADQRALIGESDKAAASASGSYAGLSEQVDGVTSSLQELATALDEANGKNLDAREAARQLESAYREFDDAVAENGKTLDITTEAGSKNQDALDAIARAALDSGQAIIDAGGSYEEYRTSLESSRTAILQRIADLGYTGDAAIDLADQILSIPSETAWKFYADTAQAESNLQRLVALYGQAVSLKGIPHYEGSVLVQPTLLPSPVFKADGGIVKYYAGGGVEHHVAQVARAGTMRVWAEPETGGEAYIPLAPAKRPRAAQVLAQVAEEFGYQLVPAGSPAFDNGSAGSAGAERTRSREPMQIEGRIEFEGGLYGVLRGHLNDGRL